MKKIIQELEERNKVIQAIEKNLRINNHKSQKTPQKSIAIINHNTIDLPHIPHKNCYSPKSQAQYLQQKKVSYKQTYDKQTPKKHTPWIQTLTFKQQQTDQADNPKIILNNRLTVRNFMRTSQNLKTKDQSSTIDHSIFLSPRKVAQSSRKQLPIVRRKIVSLPKRLSMDQRQNFSTEFSKHSDNNINSMQNLQSNQSQNKRIPIIVNNNQANYDYQFDVYRQNLHKSDNKHINKAEEVRKTRLKYGKQKKKNKAQNQDDRLYSPWNADPGDIGAQIWQL